MGACEGMNYKDLIDPELRPIAKKIPYNRVVIAFANRFPPLSPRLTAVPKEAAHGGAAL